MIEPEVAYLDLDGLMDLAEGFLLHILKRVLEGHRADLQTIGRDVAKLEAVLAPGHVEAAVAEQAPPAYDLIPPGDGAPKQSEAPEDAVAHHAKSSGHFARLSYDEAHAMLDEAFKAGKIEQAHTYGDDFGSPDETYIANQFTTPVMIHRYPAAVKAFYMQPDPKDPTKALCVDVLAPEGYGEIIGGSQRIHDYDLLKSRIEEHDLPLAAFQWYLDLRK